MDITINNAEINKAIVQYVAAQGIDIADKRINVEFTVGRKNNGTTATIYIDSESTDVSENLPTEEIVEEVEESIVDTVVDVVTEAASSIFND